MLKGVQMYTLRDHISNKEQFEASLRRVKQIGYDCVQMGTPVFMKPREVKSLIDEIGLYSCTAYADFEQLAANPASIKAVIEEAKVYDTDLVGIGTLPEKMRDSRDGFKHFAKTANVVASELYKEGCKLIYHPHALEFFSLGGGDHGMNILLNETDPSCFYFSLDTHWLASGGVNPVEWIYKVEGRMPMVHFKDYAIGGNAATIESVVKLFAEVGEGNLDWTSIVDACHKTSVKYAIVEQDICQTDPYECIKTSYQNMLKFNA